MRRRLVILAKYFPPDQGGMETYVKELAEALREDFDLHVLAHAKDRHGSEEARNGYRLVRCGTLVNALSQPFSPAMATQLRRLRPDLVHLNAPNAFATACWAMLAPNARLLITHHADVIGRRIAKLIYQPLYARAVARARRVIVFSRKNAATSIDLPRVGERLVEIPQGLDPLSFPINDAARAQARERRSRLAGEAPMAFFIGRLIGYKGLDILLRALELVPGAHAAIAGDGLLRDELERQASALGVADRAHFLGPISEQDKLGWLHASDLFVLPSVTNAEAFGIVQVEAQMCGLPVVASNLPTGVSDVTVDGETGFLVEPGDARALAGAMAAIFADKARARAMGEAGRRRAHEKYSREAFQRANREVFRAVAEEP